MRCVLISEATPGNRGHDAVQEMVLSDDRRFSVIGRAAAMDAGTLDGLMELSN